MSGSASIVYWVHDAALFRCIQLYISVGWYERNFSYSQNGFEIRELLFIYH